ncbi:hypothetical protein FF1_021956 [Malus domestica]
MRLAVESLDAPLLCCCLGRIEFTDWIIGTESPICGFESRLEFAQFERWFVHAGIYCSCFRVLGIGFVELLN